MLRLVAELRHHRGLLDLRLAGELPAPEGEVTWAMGFSKPNRRRPQSTSDSIQPLK